MSTLSKEYKLRMIRQCLERIAEIEDDERGRRNSHILDEITIVQLALAGLDFPHQSPDLQVRT